MLDINASEVGHEPFQLHDQKLGTYLELLLRSSAWLNSEVVNFKLKPLCYIVVVANEHGQAG
jgi:hypothetical protein